MAPMISNGSFPDETVSGNGVSGGSSDKSSSQAKNRKIAHDGSPVVTGISRCVHLPAGGAEIHPAGIERVNGHRVAQHVDVAVALRQAVGKRLPLVSAGAAAIDAQLSFVHIVFAVALDGDDVNGLRLVSVNVDYEPEVGWQIPADLVP